MMRNWLAVALLAGSWLLGWGYYYPPDWLSWIVVVAAATVLLSGGVTNTAVCRPHPGPLPEGEGTWGCVHSGPLRRGEGTCCALLLLPVIYSASWPDRAAPLLLLAGLLIDVLRVPHHLVRRLGKGCLLAGAVLFAQGIALTLYAWLTARSHELFWPLPDLLAGVARLLGSDAAAEGSLVAMPSLRRLHRLAATWELLLDPASVCFLVGCIVMLCWMILASVPRRRRRTAFLAALRTLALVFLAWLPLRAALMMTCYLQRVLRSEGDGPLHAMNHCFSPWVLLLLLLVPAALMWRFLRPPVTRGESEAIDNEETEKTTAGGQAAARVPPATRAPRAACPPVPGNTAGQTTRRISPKSTRSASQAALVLLAAAIVAVAVYWDPIGTRRAGRVMIVERHATWEPTTRPYDTAGYGEPSSYTYAVLYDYLGQYYQMSRLLESDKIDDATLGQCDVLIIKTPTARYAEEEVAAVQQFVRQGGGLLLVGDHTNVFNSSTIINDIIRPMGFSYRNDLLFGMAEAYEELYTAPLAAHPVVQHLPPMDFAVSCSIDPGSSRGRAVILGTGLWSMPPEYHHENYHPIPEHCPEMRFGTFVQLWAARYGKGRVLPFTDSTIFSNFCLFQPGKAEMMLGMIEWLNHADAGDPRPWLLLLAIVPAGAGLWLCRGLRRWKWLTWFCSGACGWVLAAAAVGAVQRQQMPPPKAVRPQTCVVVDRTVSDVPLSKGAYTEGGGKGYGLLEQWLPRLGYFTRRRSGAEVFGGEALAVICPDRPVTAEFRQRLIHYVADGGKLLLLDSPENTASTANSLLWPFGLSLVRGQFWQGSLLMAENWPSLKVEQACEVSGGKPVARLGQQRPVAAWARFGKGSVLAVGCGSLWNDAAMGESWMTVPDAALRTRYEALYALLRLAVEGKPVIAPPPATPEPKEEPITEPDGRH